MKIDWIDPDILAAGSVPFGAHDIQSLHQQSIRAILSLTAHPLIRSRTMPPDLFSSLDITYLHAPVRDHYPPDMPTAQTILEFIDTMKTARRPIFVHCHAGVGRTGTILHLYFLAQGMNLPQAHAQVKARRIQSTLLSEAQWTFLNTFATHE